jgi:hypothetical protein
VKKFNCNTNLISDGYVKFYNFDDLYENYESLLRNQEYKYNNNHNFCCDRYLLATVVGCIEGNIKIDVESNSWYIWFGQYHAGYKVDSNKKFPYILLSIYEFIKNHDEYYNFIKKYYDLWHCVPKYENLEFFYDEFHIMDMQDNYKNLLTTMNRDLKIAKKNMDNCIIMTYEILYSSLLKLFFSQKMYNLN